mmetsp:Transcript_24058/g.49527  ORF Transcript_24058/g.49527 Transcript_24058/m.49527 type:complete len:216 (+) Transcript_24058:847-1494(+)
MDRRPPHSARQIRQQRFGREGGGLHRRRRAAVGRNHRPAHRVVEHRRQGQGDARLRLPKQRLAHRGGDRVRGLHHRRGAHHSQAVRERLQRHHFCQADRGVPRDHVEKHQRGVHRRSQESAGGLFDQFSQVRRGPRAALLRGTGSSPHGHGSLHRQQHPHLHGKYFQSFLSGNGHTGQKPVAGGQDGRGFRQKLEGQKREKFPSRASCWSLWWRL